MTSEVLNEVMLAIFEEEGFVNVLKDKEVKEKLKLYNVEAYLG